MVSCFETSVPGLVVHRQLKMFDSDPARWSISHKASGYGIAHGFKTRNDAMAAASVGGDLDWTLTKDQIKKRKAKYALSIKLIQECAS